MKRDNTPWRPLAGADLDWTDAGAPHSTRYADVYYSRENGPGESRYVFLGGNDLPTRWYVQRDKPFCIAETGFGTGLNFLLTWQAWLELPQPRPALHYLSVEKYPLAPADLARALDAWPSLSHLSAQLLDAYPGLLPGQHRIVLQQGCITLDLWWEDVRDALPDLAGREQPLVDAWYLDGFAPAQNEAMWSAEVLRAVAALSRPGASFGTFTAAGTVRRTLAAAGFEVQKVPGYGRKRECLRGRMTHRSPAPRAPSITPWDLPRQPGQVPASALVLGGGLAGCTVAATLARRGIRVTLLEQHRIAGAGSGNDQGILYTRLSRRHSALTDFALQSFRFASTFYRAMLHSGQLREGLDGSLCGSFHQCTDASELAALAAVLGELPELAQVLEPAQASDLLGATQTSGGYWYPASGWLRPAAVCQALLRDSAVTVREDCGEIRLQQVQSGWQAMAGREVLARAPCAIVATGTSASQMPALSWLPLQSIRGQTTHLATTRVLGQLRAALCHQGYVAPARQGVHCIGATFSLEDTEAALRPEDHRHNLQRLAAALPACRAELLALDPARLDGRVGFRCASPDYLPMVGAVPDTKAFLRDFAPLRKNARRTIESRGDYMPGLFLTTAHGSRGLTSTPLAAELLASAICHEPPPLSRELCRALAPARFIIRDLARNRI